MKTLMHLTSNYDYSKGGFTPVRGTNLMQRIYYRGLLPVHHLANNFLFANFNTPTQAQRQENYEVRCLENNIRPFGYPDNLWAEFQREFADVEFDAIQENKNAWRYAV